MKKAALALFAALFMSTPALALSSKQERFIDELVVSAANELCTRMNQVNTLSQVTEAKVIDLAYGRAFKREFISEEEAREARNQRSDSSLLKEAWAEASINKCSNLYQRLLAGPEPKPAPQSTPVVKVNATQSASATTSVDLHRPAAMTPIQQSDYDGVCQAWWINPQTGQAECLSF